MNKKNLYLIVLLLTTIILMPKPANTQGQGVNYEFRFESGPIEVNYENYTGMEFKISFGGFKLKPCDYDIKCIPPPVMFFVQVLWQNPNDLTRDPNCWIPVYVGFAAYGPGGGPGGGYIHNIHGIGSIELLNPDHYGDPDCCCCYCPLRCERSYWKVSTWPLVSGIYKVKLYKFNYPEFEVCSWCFDEYLPPKLCEWGWPQGAFVAQRELKVKSQLSDYGEFMQLYFLSADGQDSVFNGYTLKVMDDYNAVCKIITTRRIEDAPKQLFGYLLPEDALTPIQITFDRWPEEDYQFPCNQNYPVRIYAYKFNESFKPYQLFPGIDPAEWSNLTKYLDCYLYGVDNNMQNNIAIRATVMAGLQLDCKNDSTVCFIPAAGEDIEFVFRYGPQMGFDSQTDIRFRIRDSDELWLPRQLVYEIPIILRDIDIGPNEWGIPDPQQPDTVRIFWDGRANMAAAEGHLANPDNDPYHARVEVLENDNPILASNTEMFDLVPMIDSVLVTHHPFYPPTEDDPTTVYTTIKAKIDDSGSPEMNYRYYIPMADYPGQNPEYLDFWKNEWLNDNYMFWDADYHDDLHRKFYENNDAQMIGLSEWNTLKLGNLDYRWLVIKDQRIGRTNQVSYENVVDTTGYLEDLWKIELARPPNWSEPDTWPYMRLLLYLEIRNYRNGYFLQSGAGADGPDAHKVMFMFDWWRTPEIDLADWATSHIGVPYTYGVKIPYISTDCAGLVTTCRIEQLGPGVGDYLSIAHIYSYVYYRGYLDPEHPEYRFTEIVEDPRLDPDLGPGYRGLLLFLHAKDDDSDEWINSRHIAIVYYLTLNPETGIPERGLIVHARGESHTVAKGRVRYEDAIDVRNYPPYYDIDGYRDNKWIWTFIKFIE